MGIDQKWHEKNDALEDANDERMMPRCRRPPKREIVDAPKLTFNPMSRAQKPGLRRCS